MGGTTEYLVLANPFLSFQIEAEFSSQTYILNLSMQTQEPRLIGWGDSLLGARLTKGGTTKSLLAPTANKPLFLFSHNHPLPSTPDGQVHVGAEPTMVQIAAGSQGLFTLQLA
jgi:hypothetical protein